MPGIYSDDFVQLLRDKLQCEPTIDSRSIIVRCPWCEQGKALSRRDHYHLHINLNGQVFYCFKCGKGKKMVVGHLISHITGKDTSFKYVNHEQEAKHGQRLEVEKRKQDSIAPEPIIPPVDVVRFKHKADYIKQRLNPKNDRDKDLDLTNMRGLIFDVDQFVLRNQITMDLHQRHRLHDEYFGVLTDHNFFVSFRSVNPSTSDRYKYWRMQLAPTFYAGKFPDFRKFNGRASQKDRDEYLKSQQANWMSKKPRSDLMLELDRESAKEHALSEIAYRDEIVIGEGIFDVMTEWLHDSCGLADRVRGYYCAFSKTNIAKMLGAGSITIYEKMFLPVVHILADSDTPLDFFREIVAERYYNTHKMVVYYNEGHEDWNCFPLRPRRRSIRVPKPKRSTEGESDGD